MKKFNKVMALVLSVAVVLAMSVPMMAFAAELPSGTKDAAKTITITSPSDLQASDKTTYTIYKVFNATSNGTSNNINYTKLTGKTLPLTATDNLSKFDEDTSGNIHYYTRTDTSADWVENKTETQLSDAMISAIGTYIDGDTAVGTVEITGPNTAKTVTVPDYGYYYITTTTGTVVTIDSTNPYANVIDKNSVPSVDKTITGVTNNGTVETGGDAANGKIGDVVTYDATIHAKKGAVNYIFHDKLSNGLSLEAQSNLVVKIGETTVDPSNYTVKYWNDTDATNQEDTEAGDNITIRFDNAWLKQTITADTDIVVTYKAKINDDAVIASTGNPNTIDLEYGHDPSDKSNPNKPTKRTEEDVVKVYTYALALKKVNVKGEPLDKATFEFPFYVKKTPARDGSYVYAFATLPETFKDGDSADNYTKTIDTPANGEITVKGVQNVEYSITETVAPEGYNKLVGDVKLTPVKTGETVTTTSKEVYLDEDGNVIAEKKDESTTTVTYTNNDMAVGAFEVVVNKSGTELPSTGGIGTTIFYVLGAILVIGAGVLLVTRRRMNAN